MRRRDGSSGNESAVIPIRNAASDFGYPLTRQVTCIPTRRHGGFDGELESRVFALPVLPFVTLTTQPISSTLHHFNSLTSQVLFELFWTPSRPQSVRLGVVPYAFQALKEGVSVL